MLIDKHFYKFYDPRRSEVVILNIVENYERAE